MKRFSIIVLALLLAAVFSLPASSLAATNPGVKPGSFFYFFDTAFEKIGLFFIANPEKKARKALEYADERLAEVEAIAEEKDSNAVKTAIANYENNVALAAEKSKEVKDKGQVESLFSSIKDNASKNQEILSAVLIKVPEEAREAVMKAIEASKKGQEEAIKQIAELKSEVEKLKQEVAELKTKDEKREKVIEELSKQKLETPSKATPIRTKVEDTSALKSETTSQNGNAQQVKKTSDNNIATVAENFSSAVASALLSQSKSYQDLVDFAEGAIQYVDISLDELATLIAKNEGYVSVLGPENSEISLSLIRVYKEDMSNSNAYKTQLISYRDTAKKNASVYKNAALTTTSKFVDRQEFISTIETLKNDTNWGLSKDYLFKTYENYVTYRKNKDNFYVKTDAELRALYTLLKKEPASTPIYQPQIAPTFQMPQLPRTTSCTLSGDGGVGLQAYMNCITY